MREILFHSKRKDNGERVEGHLIVFPKSKITKIMVWNAADLDFDAIEVRPETVGQFTGKTDKHGKRIFEQDVVSFDDAEGNTIVCGVYWDTPGGTWMLNHFATGDNFALGYYDAVVEVIGNIHDNPELMEGGASND